MIFMFCKRCSRFCRKSAHDAPCACGDRCLSAGTFQKAKSHVHEAGGFTILEVLLVLALGTLLAALTVPVGLRYYQTQVFDETVSMITGTLTRAANEARLGRDDAAHGVKFFSDRLVHFTGTDYASRDMFRDEVFPFPSGAALAAVPDEFVFAELTGFPVATGTATLFLYGNTRVVAVTANGMISIAEDGS